MASVTKLRQWLARLLRVPPYPYYHSASLWNGLTLEAWKRSETRTRYAQDLLRQTRFRELMSVLQNTMPVPGDSIFDAGRVRGYQTAVQVILEAARPAEAPQVPVEATYDTPVNETVEEEP